MAEPITNIHCSTLTEEEQIEIKFENLKKQFVDNEESVSKVLEIMEALNDIGALEAVAAMLLAKEDIAKNTLDQVSREPVINLLNTIIRATSSVMTTDTEKLKNLDRSAVSGINESHNFVQKDKKVKMFDLMKVLNDPDINRAIGFGIHFLKGMGKQLNEESDG